MRLLLPLFLLIVSFPMGLWAQSYAQEENSSGQATPTASQQNPTDGFLHFTPLKHVISARSVLDKHGVTIGGWLQFDGSHVVSGGLPRSIAFDGQYLLDISATVDMKQLIGWKNGAFLVDMQSHSGPNIVTHQVPGIQDPDNMDAYSETSIDRVWFQQDLLRQRLQLRVGLMYVDEQFLTVPYGQNFVSLDFSSDASISTFVLPTYPKGSFGGDAFVYPVKGLYFSAGVFNDHSTELPYDPGGNLYLTEEGWKSSWHGLPYKLQIGGWRDTGRFRRFIGGTVHHASGVYFVGSRKLWQPAPSSDRGVGMFFQFGTGPPAVAAVRRHFGAGLVWTGPTAARNHDEIGLAFSDSLLTAQNSFSHGFENEIEGYYQIYVSRRLTIQPDVEYWQHPGGMTTPNSFLFLVRIQYSF
ncbi:MAG: carbohydrate porin [Acidobacteria bacterium]|nr:carbohydrate porin [Acidobacteriota bacterium]